MEFFIAWFIFASVQLVATMSPGPAFAVVFRNAAVSTRRAGVMTAIGLGIGVGVHVFLVLAGLAMIVTQSVLLFSVIKYAGAAYLIYIGIKGLRAKKQQAMSDEVLAVDTQAPVQKSVSDLKALRIGILTNLLNPKAMVFFTAVFTQFIAPGASVALMAAYGVTSVAIEVLWFAGLSFVLTDIRVQQKFKRVSHWVDRVCGGLLTALGVKLAL